MRFVLYTACVLVACKSEPKAGEGKPAPGGATEPAKPAGAPSAPAPTNARGCTATITGGQTAEIKTENSNSAVSTSYWFAAGDKDSPYKDGSLALIVNCDTPAASISIASGSVTKESLPFGPMKYALDGTDSGPLHIVGHVGPTSVKDATGTIEITAFDNHHVAGTFDLTAKTLPDKGPAKIVGRFDFTCPAFLSGCTK